MKTLLCFLSSLCLSLVAHAEGPLRILYFDPLGEEPATSGLLHQAMAGLGRDAIYFDYVGSAGDLTPELASHYHLALVRGPVSGHHALGSLQSKGLILPFTEREDVAALRERIVQKAKEAGLAEGWVRFLEEREKERREPNANVANYEKRPEPLTFQHPFSVKGSKERTQVPADMKLELFASEPQIRKPIAFAWDDRGRCWVAETSDYPHGVAPDGEGHDSIRICEDTDGDGRADKFTVFADKLNIPTGIVFANGGIIVSQPPRFLFLQDTDGDDRADVRREIMTGWGIGDTHAQAGSLHYGMDNWLYGAVGYSGFKGESEGTPLEFGMGTYRFRQDGSNLEFLHQFTNNTWAHSENAAGDQFGGTANGAPLFFGGIPRTRVPAGVRVMTAKKINVVDQAHTITPNFRQVDVFGGYTSAAGSSFLYSKSLPARFQGCAMVCEPTLKIVSLLKVETQGAGYVARDAYNLLASSDEWMSPVFAEVGPDGAVWVADWQNFIIQHNPTPSPERGGYRAETGPGGAHRNDLRDHERGRIYRIISKHPDRTASEPVLLHGASTEDLVRELNHNVPMRRLQAQQKLVEGRKQEAVDGLRKMVLANDRAVGAIHALWVLHGLGQLDPTTHQAALLAHDAALRRNAVRALGKDTQSQSLYFGAGMFHDADPATRLAALVKLAEFPATREIKTLVIKLAGEPGIKGDEWLSEAAKLLAKVHGADAYKEGPNLLPNPGFETLAANGLPEGWTRRDYGGPAKPGNAGADWAVVTGPNQFHSGERGIRGITRAEGDTSFFAKVKIKPGTNYRLSGWIRTHGFKGKASLNDHLGRAETDKITRASDWTEVEVVFNSKERTDASINLLHVGKGDVYFDDVKLCELLPVMRDDASPLAGDARRGEEIFWKHPVAACMNCHVLGGKGSAVGPALDGIASRKDEAYLLQSLMEPNARLADGYTATPVSPMPPLGLILNPQELADIKAFVLGLK